MLLDLLSLHDCIVIVFCLFVFSRKESLENKKSEKSEGDQKKPKDSKVFIFKICLFRKELLFRPAIYVISFMKTSSVHFFPGKGNSFDAWHLCGIC